ncbi:MAG: hypothetical protein R3C11_21725 [Planctomycetaceae bacterium]
MMNQTWQLIIALLLVGGGLFYLGLKLKTLIQQLKTGKGGSACGTSCNGCSSNQPAQTLVNLQLPEQQK